MAPTRDDTPGAPTLGYNAQMHPLLVLPAVFSSGARAAPVDQLLAADGWKLEGTADHDLLGTVSLSLKTVSGVQCLKGEALVQASADKMLGVVQDIDGALSWSTAGLSDTGVLGQKSGAVEYFQVLDVPDWTMAADRYWVLRATTRTGADGAKTFVWDRFDWRTAYPELATRLATEHAKAVEPDPNFGAWSFLPGGSGTKVLYYLCTESGSLPGWLQKAAATKTLPAAMADVVREAKKRGG